MNFQKITAAFVITLLFGWVCLMCNVWYNNVRDPVLLKKEGVRSIVDARAVGGYRSSTKMEVKMNTGQVFVLNSVPPGIRIGAKAYLHTWDKEWAKHSLSWEGSGSSYYLED